MVVGRVRGDRKTEKASQSEREYYILLSKRVTFVTMEGKEMPMVKKSISVTTQQDGWIKAQIATGHFGNESEVFRELIRERQLRDQETTAEIKAIRKALIKGEESGFSDSSVDEIWEEARYRHRAEHA